MSLDETRSRPQADPRAAEAFGGAESDSTAREADVLAHGRRSEYAVRVTSERIDGAVVSRLYVNLDAAAKSVRRAHARGLAARLELVRLMPVVGDPAALMGGVDDA